MKTIQRIPYLEGKTMKTPGDIFIALWLVLFCLGAVLFQLLIRVPALVLAVVILGSGLLFALVADFSDWIWRHI